MSLVSPVFEQHYKDYLARLAGLDLEGMAFQLGGQAVLGNDGPGIELPFFNRPHRISPAGIRDHSGRKPGYDTCIILCRYLIMARDWTGDEDGPGTLSDPDSSPDSDRWAGFRDLRDSGPLTVYFKDNVEQVLLTALAGKMGNTGPLEEELGAVRPDMDVQYDLCLEIRALPRVPVLILANEAEDGFPPSCSVLFRPEVEQYIDAECIAMAGYRLARIIKKLFS